MKRMVTLINQLASASVTTAAIQAQADNSDRAAKKYMEDNELLKQVGITLVGQDSNNCKMNIDNNIWLYYVLKNEMDLSEPVT